MIRLDDMGQIGRDTDFIEIAHSGDVHRIFVRRVAGAKRFILRVRAAKRDVVLSMPPRGKYDDAKRFAEQHAAWIGARLRRLPEPIPFVDGSVIPLRGFDHIIVHKAQSRGTVWTEAGGLEGAHQSNLLCAAGDQAHLERRISDYLKKQARLDLVSAVEMHSKSIGVKARQVTLRDTASRWGSCSASGSLNFSWRLILAPSFVLNYLAAHEVSHLKHMDHSKKFWDLTRSLCAQTDSAEAWLSANGAELYRYGKSA